MLGVSVRTWLVPLLWKPDCCNYNYGIGMVRTFLQSFIKTNSEIFSNYVVYLQY